MTRYLVEGHAGYFLKSVVYEAMMNTHPASITEASLWPLLKNLALTDSTILIFDAYPISIIIEYITTFCFCSPFRWSEGYYGKYRYFVRTHFAPDCRSGKS